MATRTSPLPPRAWIGIAIAVVSLMLILVNWETTEISFLVFTASMPLTIALALAFLGGMATGALVSRRRGSR